MPGVTGQREDPLSIHREGSERMGEGVRGVKTRLNTGQKVLALTFDACGGPGGSGYNGKLIEYLESEKIPATLFISGLKIMV